MSIGYGQRLVSARMRVGERLAKTVSQGTMADLVSAELKRLGVKKSLSQSIWSDYESEKSEPSIMVFTAAANVAETSPAYLAFGDEHALEAMRAERAYLESRLKKATEGRTAPIAQGFQRMSSKELRAEIEKAERKKA